MKLGNLKYLVFGFLLLSAYQAKAQFDPCLSKLKDAVTKSEQGWFDEAIALLNSSLEGCELSDNDKIQAYKLLITNYLFIDKLEEAEASAAAIMKIEPNYEADKLRDPAEMVALFEKYKRAISLKVVLYGGINNALVQASQTYSVVGDNDALGLDNYQISNAFQIGLGLEYRISELFWLEMAPQFRRSSYSIDVPNIEGRTVSYKEDLNFFDVPLGAKFYFMRGSFQPYAAAGLNFSLLSSALGELFRDEISDLVNRNTQRNSFYLGYYGGLGLAYNYKNYGLQIGANYIFSPQQVNKDGTRYENLDIVFRYYYLDNDFSMNNLQFNLGFKYAIAYNKTLNPAKR
jgi:opacity protein-like surface antigen